MRMLGGWIALTPELPAKLLMGRHVWDCAQHADAWGRRLPELRAPAQESEAPSDGVARLMDAIEDQDQPGQTPERLVSIYRVIKPQLLAAYERHLAEANAVYEPPTRRILERCIADERRHVATAIRVADHLLGSSDLRARAQACEARARARLAEAGGITGDGEMLGLDDPAAPHHVEDVAADLLELEWPLKQWPLPEKLAVALGSYTAALRTGELAVPDVSPLTWTDAGVVACARVGAQWLVKLRLAHALGAVVLQTRWTEEPGGWQVAEVEVLARERSSPA
jgi:hypothetical protein